MNWSITISIAIFTLLIGVLGTYFVVDQSQMESKVMENLRENYDVDGELAEFLEFLNHFRTAHYFYDEEVDLIHGAIAGMVAQTNDPWARLLTVEEYWTFAAPLFGSFSGIGVRMIEVDEYAIVVEVLENSPARSHGIRLGDAIISVDGEQFEDYDFEDFVGLIIGESDTVVTLEIQRADDSFYLDVRRDNLSYENVIFDVFEHRGKQVGYVQVLNFGMTTQADFSYAISRLEQIGIEGLVIDMRDNPGGAMATLNEMVTYLLPQDRLITTTVNRDGSEHEQRTRGDEQYRLDMEIVTLINGGSASASEFFAAAMIESGNFPVLGTTTFGKGTAQSPLHVGDYILMSTLQEGFTPFGNPIEGYGVEPTIYVEEPAFYSFSFIHLSPFVTLEYDMVDVRISNAQLILDLLGYELDRTDGYFDVSTVEAVRTFQRMNRLSITGYINAETATALSLNLLAKIDNAAYDAQLLAALNLFASGLKDNQ